MRGSILERADAPLAAAASSQEALPIRPETLNGTTYKVKWPTVDTSFYVTINNHAETGKPFEIFITSTSAKYTDWTTALTLMISAIMRKGGDISFVPHELQKVVSATDSAWIAGKFYGSLVALIGDIIGKHLGGSVDSSELKREPAEAQIESTTIGDICEACGAPAVIQQEGCNICTACGYSNCG